MADRIEETRGRGRPRRCWIDIFDWINTKNYRTLKREADDIENWIEIAERKTYEEE